MNDISNGLMTYDERNTFIEKRFQEAMLCDGGMLNESDEYTYPIKDAPKVEGYFGFISLRYPKRVKNIKKCCVDYINGYVDAVLNVIKNGEKVDFKTETKNLVASLKPAQQSDEKEDGNGTQADKKQKFAFLQSDKAANDKLNSLLKQIDLYSSKNESLREWARLMAEKSRGIAAELVFNETSKIMNEKGEGGGKEEMDEEQRELGNALEEFNKNLEKETAEVGKEIQNIKKVGDYTDVNKGIYTVDDIEKMLNAKYNLSETPANAEDMENMKKDDPLALRDEWYGDKKSGYSSGVKGVLGEDGAMGKVEGLDDVRTKALEKVPDDKKEEAGNALSQYLLSAFYAKNSDLKNGGQVLAPIDLLILRNSIPAINSGEIAGTKTCGPVKADCNLSTYGVDADAVNKLLPQPMQLDKEHLYVIAQEYANTFGKDSVAYSKAGDEASKTNENLYNPTFYRVDGVMGTDEFLKSIE